LVAAACLFLVLGVGALPLTGNLGTAGPETPMLALNDGSASRDVLPLLARAGERAAPPVGVFAPGNPTADLLPGALEFAPSETAGAKSAPTELVVQVPKRPTTPDTARRAYTLMHQGNQYHREGQVDQAARALELAYDLCQNRVGPQHPQTRLMAMNLAHMYGDALHDPVRNNPERGPAYSKTVGPRPERPPVRDPSAAPASPPVAPGSGLMSGNNTTDRDKDQNRVALRTRLDRKKAIEIQQRVVPVLSMGLKQAQLVEDRVTLIGALSELGPSAAPSVGILSHRLHHSTEPREQLALMEALRRVGPDARVALPILNEIAVRETLETPQLPQQARELIGHLNSPAGRVGVHDSLGLFSLAAVREAVDQFQQRANKRELFVEVPRHATAPLVKLRLKNLGPQSILVVMRRQTVEIYPSATLKTETPLPLDAIKRAIQEHLKKDDPDAALREVYRLAE
jgi:hypothetical protein